MKALFAASFLNLCFVLSFFLLSSCSDEPIKDFNSPLVSFENPNTGDVIKNSITIKVTASDDHQLDTVVLSLDDKLLTKLITAPFEYTWNSLDVADGTHHLKATAIDHSKNIRTAEVDISVANEVTILTIITPTDNTLFKNGYVFISDDNGKLIDVEAVRPGTTVELKSATFHGDHFYLTECFITPGGSGFSTYQNVHPGNWTVQNPSSNTAPSAGTANLNFTNLPGSFSDYKAVTNAGTTDVYVTPYDHGDVEEISVKKSKSTTAVYLVNVDQTGGNHKYLMIPSVAMGETRDVSLSDLTNETTPLNNVLPTGAYLNTATIYGFPNSGVRSEPYYVYDHNVFPKDYVDGKLSTYYPGNAFPMYATYIDYSANGGISVTSSVVSSTPSFDTAPFNCTASFSVKGRVLTYSADGDYDLLSPFFQKQESWGVSRWAIMLSKGTDQHVVIPDLPPILYQYCSINFELNPAYNQLFKLEGVSTCDELNNYIIKSKRGLSELLDTWATHKRELIYYSLGGRISNQPENALTSPAATMVPFHE